MAQDFTPNAALSTTSAPAAFAMTAGSSDMSFSAWLWYDTLTEDSSGFSNRVFYLSEDFSATGDGWGLSFSTASGSPNAVVFSIGANSGVFDVGTSPSAWFHVYAEFLQSTTTVRVLIDNAVKSSSAIYADTSAITTPELLIGRNELGTRGWDGRMAELAWFNRGLSAGEIAALSKGAAPSLVAPGAIIEYFPFIRSTNGRRGTTLTADGTIAVAAHPRVYYPSGIWTPRTAAAAAASGLLLRRRRMLMGAA